MKPERMKNLENLLVSDFQKELFMASIKSLSDNENPLYYNNFCASFRELIRHVLSSLAPDDEIKRCSWFVPNENSKNGITRAHAVNYIVHGGIEENYAVETLRLEIDEKRKELLTEINELNKYVHVNEDTFNVEPGIANEGAAAVVDALTQILAMVAECQKELASAIESDIHDEVIGAIVSETLDSIDEIATHHAVDEVEVEEVKVVSVDSQLVHVVASGNIYAELQWGSNGDRRRGDGAVLDQSFPFECRMELNVEALEEIDVVSCAVSVDTSSWWEGYYDET